MYNNQNPFKELDTSFHSRVVIENEEFFKVQGKCIIAIPSKLGTKYISNVLLVLELNQNVLSVGQMLERRYSLYFEDMCYKILDSARIELIIMGIKDKSFPLTLGLPKEHTYANELDNSKLWHKRLGHLSHISLKKISSKLLLKDLSSLQ